MAGDTGASAVPIAADRARRRAAGDVIELAPSVISLRGCSIAVEVATSRRARRDALVLRCPRPYSGSHDGVARVRRTRRRGEAAEAGAGAVR